MHFEMKSQTKWSERNKSQSQWFDRNEVTYTLTIDVNFIDVDADN